jgi:hypothetical protein
MLGLIYAQKEGLSIGKYYFLFRLNGTIPFFFNNYILFKFIKLYNTIVTYLKFIFNFVKYQAEH